MSRFHEAVVRARALLSPGMVRLTLGVRGFATTGQPDEYLRLFFPNPETGRLHLPEISDEGRWTYPDGGPKAVRCATYTVRAHRAAEEEIDIDFVVHDGGVASDWAQRAAPGDRVTINRPQGIYQPPADAEWQLLVADATGIPAVARILEQTPADRHSRVFIEVADAGHEQALPAHPGASVTWIVAGNGTGPSRFEAILRSVPLPQAPGYIWVAGEQKAVRAARRLVRQEWKWPAGRYDIVAYWVHEGEAWDAKWEALPAGIRARIEAAWSADRDPEDIQDDYDAALEQLGL